MMVTTTLFKYIQSELIKMGFDEFIDGDNLVLFDSKYQFTTKILTYDDDVSTIIDSLFLDQCLNNPEHDRHFKKGFLNRFINRQINRQTIEAFQMELLSTFLTNEKYINTVYEDLDLFVQNTSLSEQKNKQKNNQITDGTTTSDNRSAFADLPQSTVNLDVDSTKMDYPSDNTISRNRQQNNQSTDGESEGETTSNNRSYQLDMLIKSNGLLENIYKIFDKKCFLQIW